MKRLLLVSVFALAACQTGVKSESPPATAAQGENAACQAERFAHLVGGSGDAMNPSMFPGNTRILRPGMVMTMDYRGDRLNVVINEAGKVDRVYCG